MANQLDSFSAQIVSYVRTGMSDEAVLELVKNKLGLAYGEIAGAAASGRSAARSPRAGGRKAAAPAAPAPSAGPSRVGKKARKTRGRKKSKAPAKAKAAPRVARVAATPSAPPRAAKAKPGRRKKAGRRGGGNREQEMEQVERVIKASKGMSASEISTKTKIPQSRVSAHVRALKSDKRIFQGGDRRFARYAGDQKAAEQASEDARKNAAGPRRS